MLGACCCSAPRGAAALRPRRARRERAPPQRAASARRSGEGGEDGGGGGERARPAAPGTSSAPSTPSLPALAGELSRALGQLGGLFPPSGGASPAAVDPGGARARAAWELPPRLLGARAAAFRGVRSRGVGSAHERHTRAHAARVR
jgi:hypothetical protein